MFITLLIVAAAISAVWIWPYLWFRLVNRFIDIDVEMNQHFVEIGDIIQMKCTVTNRSYLPCPSLRLLIHLPEGIVADDENDVHYLRLGTHLRGRESIVCDARCRAVARGPQPFQTHPVEVVLSEGLGLIHLTVQRKIAHELAVWPERLASPPLKIAPQTILGDLEVRRWLCPDESLFKGLRPYHMGDPFKHISWPATAATGTWMVKEFLTSSDATIHLVLNAQFHQDHWLGTRREEFDALCAMLAAAAMQMSKYGFALQFWTNATYQRDATRQCFGTQSSAGIRALLATLQPFATVPFAEVYETIVSQSKRPAEVLVFTSFLTETDARQLAIRVPGLNTHIMPGPNAALPGPVMGARSSQQIG